jgi:hypothetical protein
VGGVGEADCGETRGSLMAADMDAKTKEEDLKAKEEELKVQFKSAPRKLQWVFHVGLVTGVLILLSYGVAAFEGYVGWGPAILRGLAQAALYFFLTAGVAFGRQRGSWWALLGFATLHSYGAAGGLMRMVRLAQEGGLNWRDGVADAITIVRLTAGVILIGLLLSRDVRNYVKHGRTGEVATS